MELNDDQNIRKLRQPEQVPNSEQSLPHAESSTPEGRPNETDFLKIDLENPEAVRLSKNIAPSGVDASSDSPEIPAKQTDLWIGRRIGSFTIVRRLATGGEGTTYEAIQKGPVERTVAIHLFKDSSVQGDICRSIHLQSIAALHHPNLVSILDANELPDGTLYLVMPLIEGERSDVWVQNNKSTPHQIAALMLSVATAIEYAHSQGVFHRNLRPSNILVTRDGQPLVTSFDWAQGKDDRLITCSRPQIGSASYIAPEQVNHSGNVNAPTVDIYGFGATLYRLLTGLTPIRQQNADPANKDVANRGLTLIRELNPDVSPDLESICLKCLEESPANRYATIAYLAEDLNFFLHDLPVSTRPIGTIRRLGRWAKRDPVVAVLSLSSAALAIFTAIVFGLFWQAELASRRRAPQELAADGSVIQRDDRNDDKLLNGEPNSLEYRRTLLHRAIGILARHVEEQPDDLQTRRQLATDYFRMGQVYNLQGQVEESRLNFLKALAEFQFLEAAIPDDPSLTFDIFHCAFALPVLPEWPLDRDVPPGLPDALIVIESLVDRVPENSDYRDALAAAMSRYARIDLSNGELDSARRRAERGLDIARSLATEFLDRPMYRRHITSNLEILGLIEIEVGRLELARQHLNVALAEARQLVAATPEIIDNQRFFVLQLGYTAQLAIRQGELDEANRLQAEALSVIDNCIASHPGYSAFKQTKDVLLRDFSRLLSEFQN